jgi:hypothetical protein
MLEKGIDNGHKYHALRKNQTLKTLHSQNSSFKKLFIQTLPSKPRKHFTQDNFSHSKLQEGSPFIVAVVAAVQSTS